MSAVIALAHDLGLGAIATGIQRPEQEAMLAELRCDAAAGELLAPAMASEELVGWLARRPEQA